ncbi:MAG: NAD(P)/FAD-dependent oxidoreductase [Lachnospiraceae bacterium]|nr:NAD(P)/FAD-dependent oxidoreductase [Lachnospiraceae bacterium]
MSKIVVVGGGAAGMLASIIAARNGHQVVLFEKNEKLGKKLYITGKGRCNITNACDVEELFNNILTNKKFMYSSIYGFTNHDMMDMLSECGLKIKTERGNRVFPDSDKSSDVIAVLQKTMKKYGVEINLDTQVLKITSDEGRVTGVVVKKGKETLNVSADSVIVATGGVSYPTTGSTGDGHTFAKELGHNVTELLPGLVPFNTKEEWVKELQGLSLKNVEVSVFCDNKEIYNEFGEMLFTHFGVSGPVILSASSYIKSDMLKKKLTMTIDLKPAMSEEQLGQRVLRETEANVNKAWKNVIENFIPKKMVPVMLDKIGIPGDKKMNSITKEERMRIVAALKKLEITIVGLRGFNEAIITRGGVATKEINPTTMESKLVKGLYFAGEVLDVDAVTGGFNLQIAWSTAYAAGISVE